MAVGGRALANRHGLAPCAANSVTLNLFHKSVAGALAFIVLIYAGNSKRKLKKSVHVACL